MSETRTHPDIIYSQEIWLEDTDAANAEAARRVALTAEIGGNTIYFSDLRAMSHLPDELGDIPTLRRLITGNAKLPEGVFAGGARKVTDLDLLRGLSGLTSLDLIGTQVVDLDLLRDLPAFWKERAEHLDFEGTPAVGRDNRLGLLSSLDGKECATQTVQYLKGTHPDFLGPAGGLLRTAAQTSAALAEAAPVEIVEIGGKAAAIPRDRGPVERLAPQELQQRLEAQAALTRLASTQLQGANVREDLPQSLDMYREALTTAHGVPPNWFTLNAMMVVARAGIADADNRAPLARSQTDALDHLVAEHDKLKPLMEPPDEALPEMPEPDIDKVSIDEIISDLDEAAKLGRGEDGREVLHPSTINFLNAMSALAKASVESPMRPVSPEESRERKSRLRRAVQGTTSVGWNLLQVAAVGTGMHSWATSTAGQSVLSKLGPLIEKLMHLF